MFVGRYHIRASLAHHRSTPLGYLPPTLQSNFALLVTDQGGELVKLPLLAPATNRLLRVATLTLDKSGTLQGTVEEVRNGPVATQLRELMLHLPDKERQKVFQNLLADFLDGAVLTSASVSHLNDFSGFLYIKYGLAAKAYAQQAGDLFLFRPCALGHKGSDLLEGKARKQAVVFPQQRRSVVWPQRHPGTVLFAIQNVYTAQSSDAGDRAGGTRWVTGGSIRR